MPQHRKLIAILIDGLSADYFDSHRARLPHLAALAAGGTRIARLAAAMPATSMPGRATMLTGVASDRHGAWGNHVFDGQGFRCALANDLQVPTVAGRAMAAGLDVAHSAAERREAEQRLAAFGATPLDSAHVPEPHRDRIATFVAPDRHSFEEKPAGLPEEQMTGRPKYISTHGLRPGDPADDRFCAFLGAGIDRMTIDRAAAEDYLPMLAGILGLPAAETAGPDLLA